MESMTQWNSRAVISTSEDLCEFVDGQLRPFKAKAHLEMCYAKLAAGDGILVAASGDRAAFFDGNTWLKIL